jgi:hypothetical protein
VAKDDGRPKCRTCNAPVAPGAGQEISRWLENKVKTYGSNPRQAAQAARLRANNQRRGAK